MSRLRTLVLALIALATVPEIAYACAVCFDGPGETRQAFFATTAFLSLLPLGMVAGTGAWLRNKARRADTDGSAESQDD
ncbi:MAG: hypothetical protein EXR91_09280 [Gemmatimonadetes bacterium]|nr:hypothetical protein [Gemmatimonadota bacterium]